MKITVDLIMKMNPCVAKQKIEEWFAGRKSVTEKTVKNFNKISEKEKDWFFNRLNVLKTKALIENFPKKYNTHLLIAKDEYLKRKRREAHPEGHFDKGGRFYSEEKCICCEGIRRPSRSFPYSEMTHCRTIKHVAYLFNVLPRDLKKIL